ncbi:MAG: 2-oxo acid dehydrogenase subunit E2 [Verrucomicrobiota bacterium]
MTRRYMNNNSPSATRANRIAASPRARRMLRQLGMDARSVRGTSWGGRIVQADVEAAAAAAQAAKASLAGQTGGSPQAGGLKPKPAAMSTGGLSVMRRAIAEKTAMSFSTAPHFYLRVEADVTSLMDIRAQLAPVIEREVGVKPTLTDFLLRAMARTLIEFPFANSIWQENTIIELPAIDVGLVVGLPDGLLIPVLRKVDQLAFAQIVKLRSESAAAARAGKLSAEATQGGAISLSNLGNSRVDEFAPVIAPPQSSMLAAGRAALRPFVTEGKLAVRHTLRLCLAADHRVMDGGPAAEFLGRLVDLMEHPAVLVRDGVAAGLARTNAGR